MFDKQSVHRHPVAIDDRAVVARIYRPAHPRAMVGAPEPEIVPLHIIRIDLHTTGCRARRRPAHPHGNVIDESQALRIIRRSPDTTLITKQYIYWQRYF